MRIVFSRKGFDSVYGGVPSPIFPDDQLCYLPIPSVENIKYSELSWQSRCVGEIIQELTNEKTRSTATVHLDPDIDPDMFPRQPGWKGLFGQTGAAQSHLREQGVGKSDIFLFFGWYKKVNVAANHITYATDAPDLHVVFGWLQIDSVWNVKNERPNAPRWAEYHPHFRQDESDLNTIYMASEKLELPGLHPEVPGAGVFPKLRPILCLTAPDSMKRSCWRLPGWFYPSGSKKAITYHSNLDRWRRSRDCVYLNTVGRGQEFVMNCDYYPEAVGWLKRLFGAE